MFMLKKERKNLCVEMIQGNNGIHFPIKKKASHIHGSKVISPKSPAASFLYLYPS